MVITFLLMQSLEICHLYEFSNASSKLITVLTHLCFLISKVAEKTDSIWNKLWYLDLWSASLKTCGERVRDFPASASPGRALSKSDGCQKLFYYVEKSVSNKSLKVYILQVILQTYFLMYFPFLVHTLTCSNRRVWWSCWV